MFYVAFSKSPNLSQSALRMALALTIFAAAVLVGVILAFGLPDATTAQSVSIKRPIAGVPAENEDAAFFYDAIGKAPTSVTAASQASLHSSGEKASYTLELKVASDRDEAEHTIDALHEHGIEAYYTPLTRAGRVVFRVRQGVFATQSEAEKAAISLRQASAYPAAVVKLQ